MMVAELNKILYMDIETAGHTKGKVDPTKDKLRFVGFRLPNGKKIIYEYPHQKQQIQQTISTYKYLAGHNITRRVNNRMNMGFDNIVMQKHGFYFKTFSGQNIIMIDTQAIAEKRLKAMMYIDFSMSQMGLDYLTKYFGIVDETTMKGQFDYDKLRKPVLTPIERKELYDYLYRDLDAGFALLKFFYEFFEGFKSFMKTSDIINMTWLTRSSGTVAYKIICNQAGLPEEYEEHAEMANKAYSGGFVALPYKDFASGSIYCIDFASLYPHMYMMGNLYSPINYIEKEGVGLFPEVWSINSGGIYSETTDAIQGSYKRVAGKIELVINKLYTMRVDVKKRMKTLDKESQDYKDCDKLQLACKIVLNTMYGISGSPKFKSVYNLTTASDCTAMARRSIKHAREILKQNGYECLYTDTDSVYVRDSFQDFKKLETLCEDISQIQRDSGNVYISTHNFEIESKIKYMYFFKGDEVKGEALYNKKHYIYVLENGKVKETGGMIVKGTCSPIAKEVYKKFLKPLISEGKPILQSPEMILEWTKQISREQPELLTKRFRVKQMEDYKSTNGKEPSSIQYQVSKMYGVGEHHLVCNKYFGAGKGVKYAKKEELEQYYGMDWLDAVNYSKYVSDLKHFCPPQDRKRIRKF